MKKILTSLVTAAVIATTASADFARVEMGAGTWSQSPTGYATRTDGSGSLSLDGTYTTAEDSSSEIYAWVLVKHPIPILPNVRLEYVSLSDAGLTNGKVNGFQSTSNMPTTLDTKQYDIIPYYNILDNTAWVTLDLGLDLKIVQSDTEIKNIGTGIPLAPTTSYSSSDITVIPLIYVRGRVEIPATNIGLESDVKAITDGTNTVYDIRAKVDYTLDFIPVVQPAIEVGYRVQQIKVDDGDTQIDLNYSGVYAGLMLRF